MRISFRRWEIRDAGSLYRLLRDTWASTYHAFIPLEDILKYLQEHHNEKSIERCMHDSAYIGFIAEVNHELAGYGKIFYQSMDKRVYVQQLYVLPKYHGMGLGKQLMAFAAEHAETWNLDRIWLSVMTENTNALLWYQNMGYHIVDKTPFLVGSTCIEHYTGYISVEKIFSANQKNHAANGEA